MRLTRTVVLVLATLLVAGVTGCTSGTSGPAVTVFAAESLKPTFTEIGHQFETEHPGVTVAFNFESSSELAIQLIQGATADVFASANTAQMDKVTHAGLVAGAPVNFASNTLVIVTRPGNPERIASFADLTKTDLKVVICQEQVPCGSATRKVEDRTGVRLAPKSEEPKVSDVLTKVVTGEADAGVVYITDALNAGDTVTTVTFPQAAEAVNTYPVAVLKNAPQSDLAQKFVELVTGEAGQKILHAAGFAKP